MKLQLIRFKAVLNLDFSIFEKHKVHENATHFRIFLIKNKFFSGFSVILVSSSSIFQKIIQKELSSCNKLYIFKIRCRRPLLFKQ